MGTPLTRHYLINIGLEVVKNLVHITLSFVEMDYTTYETILLSVLLPLMLLIVVIGCIVFWIHRRKGSRRKHDVKDHVYAYIDMPEMNIEARQNPLLTNRSQHQYMEDISESVYDDVARQALHGPPLPNRSSMNHGPDEGDVRNNTEEEGYLIPINSDSTNDMEARFEDVEAEKDTEIQDLRNSDLHPVSEASPGSPKQPEDHRYEHLRNSTENAIAEKFEILKFKKLTEKTLHETSAYISTTKKFTDVAMELGFRLNEIEIFKTNNPYDITEAAIKMLVSWLQRNPDENLAWEGLNRAMTKWIPSDQVLELYDKLLCGRS